MKSIVLAVALVVLASVLWKNYSVPVDKQSAPNGQRPDPTLLANRVKKAKAAGATEVLLPAPVPYLAETSGLADALKDYSVIIGKPTSATSIQVDARNIMTYYKFQIFERLSDRPGPSGGVPEELPKELGPLGTNEIYVLEGGGTVTIDGTKVTQKGAYEYSKNEKYLLFISKNSAESIAIVSLGQYGVFSLRDDSLEAIVKEITPLKRDLSEQHSNKVTSLRASLPKAFKDPR